MSIDWVALLVVALVSIGAAALVVLLFAMGVKLLSVPPVDAEGHGDARDDETDEVSASTRPRIATTGGVVFFVLAGAAVLYGVYLIVPALHG